LQTRPRVVHSIAPEDTVYHAIETMSEHRIGCLVVLTSDRLVGILSERDYARNVILKGRNSQTTPVREIMSRPVLFVRPTESVDHALGLMTSHRIRHLPVVDKEEVIAVLSTSDLVAWLLASQQEAIDRLNSYIEADYPA
jgi:CBS domain-containing protein